MRLILAVLLLSIPAVTQTTCNSLAVGTIASITCSDGSSASVAKLYELGNTAGYSITYTPPAPLPGFARPTYRPIPLPALAIQPPQHVDMTNLYIYAAMAKSNQPPSAKKIAKFCKKNPGAAWAHRNWQGIVVAEGKCQ